MPLQPTATALCVPAPPLLPELLPPLPAEPLEQLELPEIELPLQKTAIEGPPAPPPP